MKGPVEIKEGAAEAREGYGGRETIRQTLLKTPVFVTLQGSLPSRDVEHGRSVVGPNQGLLFTSLI